MELYKNKSVRAIGEVIARNTAVETENEVKYNAEFGELIKEIGTEDIPDTGELAKRLQNESWT